MKGQVTIGPLAASAIGFASSNEEAGRIAKTVLAYLAGKEVETTLPPHIKAECDDIIRLAEISRRNGAKGGRPKTQKNPDVTQNNPEITQTKPRNNPDETQIASRAQEETSSLMEENLPSLSKEKREHSSLKETPPPPPSEQPAFALVAEPVAQPTQPAAKAPRSKPFKKPDVFEVAAYCKERGNNVDAQTFVDFYESKGWFVGRNPMKDWKAAVRTWERGPNRGAGYLVTPPARGDPTKFYNPEGTGTDWSKLGQTYDSSPLTAPKPKPAPQTF